MIIKTKVDSKTGDKTFDLQCEKTGAFFTRVAKKEDEFEPTLSNTETAFSDETVAKFKKWMTDKGYIKSDCWCKYIKEFVEVGE